ncbi:zinc ribbon domain-containing protein [Methanobrevibacter sp.]|uniref:zinc ribbon domain-containing protein n=1 Tax=Methanobrevibacter sp. TaxID=66852 RepID=UPI0025F4D304|nr:zinc ribbon domain-containing protein [Methanobrevibacter sp.]MBQ6512562.1 zinc ribbon domain-containing protein [Methanobrevibacter sp.]
MICPNCNSENNEGAKFCKKCGTPLNNKKMDHGTLINSMESEKSDNTTKIIIIALVIVALVLAGAFIYLQGFGNGNSQSSSDAANVSTAATPQSSSSTATPQSSSSSMRILSGSFSTGSAESDKTYASIYVGTQYSGQSVIVQIWYSRDGSTLNHGNMVPVTVHSDGYIQVSSADAYHYYPDTAKINLYDSNSKLLDSKTVYLSPTSGTQTFS